MKSTSKLGLCLFITVMMTMSLVSVAMADVQITFWHFWGAGSDIDDAFQAAARAFEAENPSISVEVVGGRGFDELLVSVVGNVAPDGVVIDERVSNNAMSGAIQDITDLVERDGVDPDEFVTPSWREVVWQGKIYAIPWGADPNFGLFRNNTLLAEAGIPTDTAPATLPELDEINRKVTDIDADGSVTQIGLVPWHAYGYPNTMYTWGWVFGGSFYDYETQTVTASDPQNVRALEWMRGFVDRYTWAGMAGLGFMNNNVAFQPYGPWELPRLELAADFDYWLSVMPYHPDGGERNPTWVGGHKIAIPSGAHNRNEGWEFVRYITADPEGSAILAEPINWFPAYLPSNVYDVYRERPYLSIFADILMTASNQRPVMPAAEYLVQGLNTAVADVLQGDASPLGALQEVDRVVQSELDRILSGLR